MVRFANKKGGSPEVTLVFYRGAEGEKWSGKRDSNSRPPPWQGGALPTELFPLLNREPRRDAFPCTEQEKHLFANSFSIFQLNP